MRSRRGRLSGRRDASRCRRRSRLRRRRGGTRDRSLRSDGALWRRGALRCGTSLWCRTRGHGHRSRCGGLRRRIDATSRRGLRGNGVRRRYLAEARQERAPTRLRLGAVTGDAVGLWLGRLSALTNVVGEGLRPRHRRIGARSLLTLNRLATARRLPLAELPQDAIVVGRPPRGMAALRAEGISGNQFLFAGRADRTPGHVSLHPPGPPPRRVGSLSPTFTRRAPATTEVEARTRKYSPSLSAVGRGELSEDDLFRAD